MKNENINEIDKVIFDYQDGKISLEEANKKLGELGAIFYINPAKNIITEGGAVVKENPAEINGYAMLDTGTGTMDKVMIKDGKLVNSIGAMYGIVVIGNTSYEVTDGQTLVKKN